MRGRFAAVVVLCLSIATAMAGPARGEPSAPAPGEPACSVAGRQVFPARTGVDLPLERAGKALVATEKPFHLAFLSMPECRLEPILDGAARWPIHPISVTAGGDVLYDDGSIASKGLLFKRAGGEPQPLLPPPDAGKTVWRPTLSDDGSSIVWVSVTEGADGQRESRLQIRDLASGSERSIPLASNAEGYEVLAANVSAGEYVLGVRPNKVLVVDGNGAAKSDPTILGAIENVSEAFRRVAGGWIAWDSVRLDNRSVRLQWHTAGGSGEHEFASANIASVSVTTGGKRIAVSAPAASRLVDKGSIVVLDLPEGKVVFQRELPPYSRPSVGFLDDKHLAVSTESRVEVLYVP